MHASVPAAAWGGIPENLQFSGLRAGVLGGVRYYKYEYFSGLREGVLGEYVVQVRVRTCATRELRFSGMLPASVLETKVGLRVVLTLVRTNDVCVRLASPHPPRKNLQRVIN